MDHMEERQAGKRAADEAIDRAFDELTQLDDWNKMCLADAIQASEAGLYGLAWTMAQKALVPADQRGAYHIDPEIKALTRDEFERAIQTVRALPAREYPVFRWLPN
jgi:hypothetical protein